VVVTPPARRSAPEAPRPRALAPPASPPRRGGPAPAPGPENRPRPPKLRKRRPFYGPCRGRPPAARSSPRRVYHGNRRQQRVRGRGRARNWPKIPAISTLEGGFRRRQAPDVAMAPTICAWQIDCTRYVATPLMSDGTQGPPLRAACAVRAVRPRAPVRRRDARRALRCRGCKDGEVEMTSTSGAARTRKLH
jgi:hypothetical protein